LADEIKKEYEEIQLNLNQKIHFLGRTYSGILWALGLICLLMLYLFFHLKKKYTAVNLEHMNAKLGMEKLDLERQLLESQMAEKDRQMAANTIYAVKRNQLLQNAVEKLINHRREFSQQGQELIQGVIRDLKKVKEEKIFEEFEASFLHLHHDFYDNLLKEFPQLSLNEKRLCAFIRLNLGTKEIAAITGQTLPALSKAKVRLRKKLDLTHTEQSLHDFLSRF